MKLDFDISIVTRILQRILTELREKRLWPAAVALLAAIVAVPVVLSNSSSPAPVAQVPQGTPPPSQATSLPTLNLQTTPAQSRLTGRARDPFAQQASSSTSTTSTTTGTATGTTTSTATGGSSVTPGGSSSTTGSTTPSTAGGTTPSTPPPTITPGAKPKPAPTGLTATQSYSVSLAITNSSGGLDTIDPLERLSVLPSDNTPLLVELGVSQGGHSVLFAVQPGTVVNGPGTCTPGPIDCEILSLGQDQTEAMGTQSSAGVISGPLFAVTGITAAQNPSAAAADTARRAESATGRSLIDHSTLTALSLFQYEPSLGAVVDLRNLTVGG